MPEREQWVSECAYFRAERRGFEPGLELDDWLAAEHEYDLLNSCAPSVA
jgi:hypothetical protein